LNTTYDVLIIGAGPIGIACALECKKSGLSYVVIEKGALTNSLYRYPFNMQFFSTSEKLEIDRTPFMSTNAKPNRGEALEYYRRVVTNHDLSIMLFEAVLNVHKEQNLFKIFSDKKSYSTRKVVIATGFFDIPKLLNVPGEELTKVSHYFKEAHPYIMQNIIVVGASNSAVDAALEIWRKGGKVTIIVRGSHIGKRVKYWVKPDIENRIKEGSIQAYFNTEISEIHTEEVILKTANGEETIANDYVLALTGYQPNFAFLQDLGVHLSKEDKKPIYDEQTRKAMFPDFTLLELFAVEPKHTNGL